MAQIVRMGIAGAGVIAQRGLLPHLSQPDIADRVRLQAVCDPVPGRAEAMAARYDIPQWFTDYAEMLNRADIDAVSIATPIGLHYEQAKAALASGRHVHVNKTMTTTTAEADELVELAKANDRRIVASPGEVLRPHTQAVKRLIEDGGIGQLTWAMCGTAPGDYHVNEPERALDDASRAILPDWYFRKPGGGPLYDTTVYSLHILTSVLGAARAVTAMSGVRLPVREVQGRTVTCDADDTTLMVLDYGAGLFVFVYGVTYGSPLSGRAAFFGTAGRIEGDRVNGEPIEVPGLDPEAGRQGALPHVVGPHRKLPEAHVFEDVMQLVDWVAQDKPSPVTAEHARHVIEIFEGAYRSAQAGARVMLRTTF